MLSVESVLDVIPNIDLVNDLICILLEGSCENHNLIVPRHCFNKLDTARSDQEETIVLVLDIVDQCLIEIQNEAVAVSLLGWQRVQKGRRHFGQVGEVIGEHG